MGAKCTSIGINKNPGNGIVDISEKWSKSSAIKLELLKENIPIIKILIKTRINTSMNFLFSFSMLFVMCFSSFFCFLKCDNKWFFVKNVLLIKFWKTLSITRLECGLSTLSSHGRIDPVALKSRKTINHISMNSSGTVQWRLRDGRSKLLML